MKKSFVFVICTLCLISFSFFYLNKKDIAGFELIPGNCAAVHNLQRLWK